MNEEHFRIYALWTFAISSVYTLIYLGIFLGQYRPGLFIFLALVTATALLYWFRDGGKKFGWQSLDEGLLVILFFSVIMCILQIIACVLAVKMTNYTGHVFSEFRLAVLFLYTFSPVVLTVINFANLLIFLARN
jgi:hypothetical protein